MSFKREAEKTLSSLFHLVDKAYGDKADIDEDGEALTIEFDDGRTWLINIQFHHQEIWLSSPLTGAHHYKMIDEKWINSRNESELSSTLLAELSLA